MSDFMARGGLWVVGQAVLFALVAVVLWWNGSPDAPGAVLVAGVVLAAAGSVLAADGVLRIRRHISALPAPVAGAPLVEAGSYGLVRHPIYGGLTVAATGLAIARGSLLGVAAGAVLGGFFLLKSRHEESMLSAAHPDYERYRRRVTRRIIPWLL